MTQSFVRNVPVPVAASLLVLGVSFLKANSSLLRPARVFLSVSLVFLVITVSLLIHAVRTPDLLWQLTHGDSAQYIRITKAFAAGDFSMSYVQGMPHRQPLYPLLLMVPARVVGPNTFWLGTVNIVLCILTLAVIASVFSKKYTDRRIVSLLLILFAINRFVIEEASSRIVTEPLFILCALLAMVAYSDHVRADRTRSLWVCSAWLGFAYLARPNGLFLMGAVFVAELGGRFFWLRKSGPDRTASIAASLAALGGSLLIFVAVTFPSWIPRMHYFHRPLEHGYLSNFLWVDTYTEGHTGVPYAIFTWRDYVGKHHFMDFLARFSKGLWDVFLRIPAEIEHAPLLYLLAVIGVVAGFRQKNRVMRVLTLICFIQLLPLIWTTGSNPGSRIPYSSLLAFEVIFAAFGLQWIIDCRFRWPLGPGDLPDKSVTYCGAQNGPADEQVPTDQ